MKRAPTGIMRDLLDACGPDGTLDEDTGRAIMARHEARLPRYSRFRATRTGGGPWRVVAEDRRPAPAPNAFDAYAAALGRADELNAAEVAAYLERNPCTS